MSEEKGLKKAWRTIAKDKFKILQENVSAWKQDQDFCTVLYVSLSRAGTEALFCETLHAEVVYCPHTDCTS